MTFALEYHKAVQRSTSASLALFGMLFLAPLLVVSSFAQANGTVASGVSSGGHGFSGSSVGATSAGHGSFVPPTGAFTPPTSAFVPPAAGVHSHSPGFANQGLHDSHHQHHRSGSSDFVYPYGYGYGVPVPYAYDDNAADSNDDDDADYQGGPTVFDRRGSGRDSYVQPSNPGPAHARQDVQPESPKDNSPASPASAASVPETPQPSTVLVFKDGHQLEVSNYAIVSQTLYDLTSGHPRKVALGDLDLAATEKENDDRGVPFQLPPSAQAN